MVYVVKIDSIVLLSGLIPDTHPVSSPIRPVREMILIDPNHLPCLPRVIEPILRVFHGMDIHKDFDVVFRTSVKHPLNPLISSLHAPDIRPIWLQSPVTNRQPHNFYTSLCKLLNVFFSVPRVPMSLHYLTGALSECLTGRVRVHSDSIWMLLAKPPIKERGSYPRLKHEPAADVCTGQSFLTWERG